VADTAYFLSKDDRDDLGELLDAYRRGRIPTSGSGNVDGTDHQENQAPDVYVAFTPGGGIPVRSGVTPGAAECDLYRLLPDETLEQYPDGVTQYVYNLSTAAVPEESYVLVSRDKAGTWWVVASAGATDCCGEESGGDDCADAAGWGEDDCLRLTVISAAGLCACIDTDQVLTLRWDAGDSRWESGDDAVDTPEDDFTHCLGIGPVWFWIEGGEPKLEIDGVTGFYAGCDGGGLVFSFGSTTLCNGTRTMPCGPNVFRVKIECIQCPNPDYSGPGWYCSSLTGCDGADSPTCTYYAADPGTGVYLCSGPHATEADCITPCDAIPPCGCAATVDHPDLTVSGDGTGTLTWDGTRWGGAVTLPGPCVVYACVTVNENPATCLGTCEDYAVSFRCTACGGGPDVTACADQADTCSCSPFLLSVSCSSLNATPCCGTYTPFAIDITLA